jgi:hypothetical protein
MAKKKTVETPVSGGFTKEKILKSKRFEDRRDLLNAVLKENELYSMDDVQTMLDEYLKGKVN